MSRYHDYEDQDSYRLPEGFERIGYDADTQTYTYRGPDGTIHTGAPGAHYGLLVPASSLTDAESDAQVRDNREGYRLMLPFFLLVFVVLFCLIAPPWKKNFGWNLGVECGEGEVVHRIESGETCWGIAEGYGSSVGEIERVNAGIDCAALKVGKEMCVPVG